MSSSTEIASVPRVQLTRNSFGLTIDTLPTVGPSPFARMTAVEACKAKAFAFAVENIAVPFFSVAAAAPSSVAQVTRLAPVSSKRAAPDRTCRLPVSSVSRLSPEKTVVPTDAAARPTCARSAVTTVPNPGVAAVEIEAVVNPKDKITAAVIRERSRKRAIAAPRGLNSEY
jgi:hypothetical protein